MIVHAQRKTHSRTRGYVLCGGGSCAPFSARDYSQQSGRHVPFVGDAILHGGFVRWMTSPDNWPGNRRNGPGLFSNSRCSWRLPLSAIEPQRLAVKCGGRGRADLLNSQGRPAYLQFSRSPFGCARRLLKHFDCQVMHASESHVVASFLDRGFNVLKPSERGQGRVPNSPGKFPNSRGELPNVAG